jgi:UDP-N-acetylglucosamine--N-acetylmuramyl-(pentapeptide) pyrophosphoryl-undecaprenol N-acetylglucosamine transferase
MASRVFEAFPGSFGADVGAEVSGNPVRDEIIELPAPGERFAGRSGRLRLLVLGGSLGARALNQVVPTALALLPAGLRPEVRHQTGEKLYEEALAAYETAGVDAELKPFERDMAGAYAWADLVICRAGALTVSELAAAGVGSILVPFPYAVDDHQTRNAEFLVDVGAARLAPQDQLNAEGLAATLQGLFEDRAGLLQMAEAARKVAVPDAAAVVGRACLESLKP